MTSENIAILALCQCLLYLFSKNVIGLSEFGLNLQWERALECTYIVRLYNRNLDHCYKECAARAGCRSFNYNVRSRRCELCPVDRQTGGFARSPGVVYSDKTSWSQVTEGVLSAECGCQDGSSCEVQGTSTLCRIKECSAHPWENNPNVTQHGNMGGAGNTLVFTCAGDAIEHPNVTSMSSTCDVNTGNWTGGNITCPVEVYVGCFEDAQERSLQTGSVYVSQTTNDRCRQACEQHFYPDGQLFYFGTEIGSECFCGDQYPIHPQRPDADCNYRCHGNQSEWCGGYWRISVYKIEMVPVEMTFP